MLAVGHRVRVSLWSSRASFCFHDSSVNLHAPKERFFGEYKSCLRLVRVHFFTVTKSVILPDTVTWTLFVTIEQWTLRTSTLLFTWLLLQVFVVSKWPFSSLKGGGTFVFCFSRVTWATNSVPDDVESFRWGLSAKLSFVWNKKHWIWKMSNLNYLATKCQHESSSQV